MGGEDRAVEAVQVVDVVLDALRKRQPCSLKIGRRRVGWSVQCHHQTPEVALPANDLHGNVGLGQLRL